MAAEIQPWRMRQIGRLVNARLGNAFSHNYSRKSSISVYYGKAYMAEPCDLAKVVARDHLDSDPGVLHRFMIAMELCQMMGHLNSEGEKYFDMTVQLNRLTGRFLRENRLTRTADSVFRSVDALVRFRFLYGIGAISVKGRCPRRSPRPYRAGSQLELPMFDFRPIPYGLFFPNDDKLVYKFKLVKQGKREVKIGYIGPNEGGPEIS